MSKRRRMSKRRSRRDFAKKSFPHRKNIINPMRGGIRA